MRLSKYWDIEDIFFGALFGSVFGVYIGSLPIGYTVLLIAFFVIFPSAIRKASKMSDNVVRIVAICSAIWMGFFFIDIWNLFLITTSEWLLSFLIFLGWVASVWLRIRR